MRRAAAALLALACLSATPAAIASASAAPAPPASAKTPARPAPGKVGLLANADALAALVAQSGAQGRPVVVHFFATWCESCAEEMPVLEKALRPARDQGAAVLLVSLDEPGDRTLKVPKYLKKFGLIDPAWVLDAPDPDPVTAQFDPHWEGDLPATFVLVNGSVIFAALEPMGDPTALAAALATVR